jgi:cephalosporin hydroxylase
MGLNRHNMVDALRGSPIGRALANSALHKPLRSAAQAAASPRDWVRGYRYGQQIPAPKRTEAPFALKNALNPLEAYFDAHTEGPGIWKWRHYFDVYHRHLAPFRGQPVNIVEIGIYSGGSLAMWRDYFGPACHVYGVDIAPECRTYEDENVTVFIGDQADPEFWRRFVAEVPAIDVVIDDGGHRGYQQIATLQALLPHIRPGGVFFCEDLTGPLEPFLSFVDGLTRSMGSGGWGPPSAVQQHVASVHRYPLITVIEKPPTAAADFEAPHHGTEWQPFLEADRTVRG